MVMIQGQAIFLPNAMLTKPIAMNGTAQNM